VVGLVVGAVVGAVVGLVVGAVLGAVVGLVVGVVVGAVVGAVVGLVVGALVGALVGAVVGFVVGVTVGAVVGFVVGVTVGAMVGAMVGAWVVVPAGMKAMSSIQMFPAVWPLPIVDWITMPAILVAGSSPKLEILIATWLHLFSVGATGRLIEFPIGSPLTLYTFTATASAALEDVPPFT
jgi:hypothetical protein